jgi:hypothetical protein
MITIALAMLAMQSEPTSAPVELKIESFAATQSAQTTKAGNSPKHAQNAFESARTQTTVTIAPDGTMKLQCESVPANANEQPK